MFLNFFKLSFKRFVELEINDEKDDSLDKVEECFWIKILDEIWLEKWRCFEKDDVFGEECNGLLIDNLGIVSLVDLVRWDWKFFLI